MLSAERYRVNSMEWTVVSATNTRDSFDTPDSLVCNRVRLEVPRVTPVEFRSHSDVIRGQPVRTKAQARLKNKHTNIEAPTPQPHVSTPTDTFDIKLDHWIGTIRVQNGTGDIVNQQTQAIVNPANSHLNHFGGVARAIVRRTSRHTVCFQRRQ